MNDAANGLRARRRQETQQAIQAQAVRMFTENGYESTTVAEVAAAAGVAPMTVYRHFRTKEDLVLINQIDRLIAERITAGPADVSLVRRIGRALVETADLATGSAASRAGAANVGQLLDSLRLMTSVPALRARHLDSQFAIQQAIVDALLADETPPDEFRAWSAAGACMAALNVALMWWANADGEPSLPDLVTSALAAAFEDQF